MLDSEAIAVRLECLEGRLNTQKALMEQAKEALWQRLDGMNEFRREMSQDKLQFVNRLEWDAGHTTVENKIDSLQNQMHGKLGNDFEARIDEHFKSIAKRSEFTERMIWMATGAVALMTLLLHFVPGFTK